MFDSASFAANVEAYAGNLRDLFHRENYHFWLTRCGLGSRRILGFLILGENTMKSIATYSFASQFATTTESITTLPNIIPPTSTTSTLINFNITQTTFKFHIYLDNCASEFTTIAI